RPCPRRRRAGGRLRGRSPARTPPPRRQRWKQTGVLRSWHPPGSGVGEAAVAQVDQTVETVEDLLVMGDGDDTGFLLDGELAQKVHHQPGPRAVERGGGLVGKDDAG